MTEIAHHIGLNLAQKLRNREYRQKFFLVESSAHIAEQLIALRKRRGLDQTQLAEMIGTQQPAISRVEKADYQNWSFNTLRKIADAEDARVRVSIQPAEDVLKEYEAEAVEQSIDEEFVTALTNQAHQNLYINPWQANQGTRAMGYRHPQGVISSPALLYAVQTFPDTTSEPRYVLDAQEIARLKTENARLKTENANLKIARLNRVPGSQDFKLVKNFEGIDPQSLTARFGGQPL